MLVFMKKHQANIKKKPLFWWIVTSILFFFSSRTSCYFLIQVGNSWWHYMTEDKVCAQQMQNSSPETGIWFWDWVKKNNTSLALPQLRSSNVGQLPWKPLQHHHQYQKQLLPQTINAPLIYTMTAAERKVPFS